MLLIGWRGHFLAISFSESRHFLLKIVGMLKYSRLELFLFCIARPWVCSLGGLHFQCFLMKFNVCEGKPINCRVVYQMRSLTNQTVHIYRTTIGTISTVSSMCLSSPSSPTSADVEGEEVE